MPTKPQMWWPGINRRHSLANALLGAWMPAGGGRHVADLAGPNDGTASGDYITWSGSKEGSAIYCNEGVGDGNETSFIALDKRAYSFARQWFTMTVRFQTLDGYGGVFCLRNSGADNPIACIMVGFQGVDDDEGKGVFIFRNNSGDLSSCNSGIDVDDGVPHTMTMRLAGVSVRYYVDGHLVEEDTNASDVTVPFTADRQAFCGERRWIANVENTVDQRYLQGQILMATLHDRPLSDIEILRQHTVPYDLFCPLHTRRAAILSAGLSGTLTITPDATAVPLVAPNPTVSLGALTLTPDATPLLLVAPSIDVGQVLTPGATAIPLVAPDVALWRTVGGTWLYTAANWPEMAAFYVEVELATAAGTARARLYDATAGNTIAASEVSTSNAALTRLRSSAQSLTDGREYQVAVSVDSGGTDG